MIYIILIAVVGLYFIIKNNPKDLPKDKILEQFHIQLGCEEKELLDLIVKNKNNANLQSEQKSFESTKLNYIRLSERFKHDDKKFVEVTMDWLNYIKTLTDVVFASLFLNASGDISSATERNELSIKLQEIEKRYKDLLGDQYIDPWEKE